MQPSPNLGTSLLFPDSNYSSRLVKKCHIGITGRNRTDDGYILVPWAFILLVSLLQWIGKNSWSQLPLRSIPDSGWRSDPRKGHFWKSDLHEFLFLIKKYNVLRVGKQVPLCLAAPQFCVRGRFRKDVFKWANVNFGNRSDNNNSPFIKTIDRIWSFKIFRYIITVLVRQNYAYYY